ncbi:MAG: LuxR C-terminal-related transcriptional regulator [Planctomycetota bacterium]
MNDSQVNQGWTRKPLVAVATSETSFSKRIELASEQVGSDFYCSFQLQNSVDQCHQRATACVVVDNLIAAEHSEGLQTWRMAADHVLLFAIPRGDVDAAFRAAALGAVAVVEKEATVDSLALRLSTAFESEGRLKRLEQVNQPFVGKIYSDLSDREKKILFHLVGGEPNKRVAALLDIGLRTVEAGRAQVMKKLGVCSFAELIRLVANNESDPVKRRQAEFDSLIEHSARMNPTRHFGT